MDTSLTFSACGEKAKVRCDVVEPVPECSVLSPSTEKPDGVCLSCVGLDADSLIAGVEVALVGLLLVFVAPAIFLRCLGAKNDASAPAPVDMVEVTVKYYPLLINVNVRTASHKRVLW